MQRATHGGTHATVTVFPESNLTEATVVPCEEMSLAVSSEDWGDARRSGD